MHGLRFGYRGPDLSRVMRSSLDPVQPLNAPKPPRAAARSPAPPAYLQTVYDTRTDRVPYHYHADRSYDPYCSKRISPNRYR